jgi:uncharacterized protein YraI
MRNLRLLAAAALVGAMMVPGIAAAANAYTTGNVNQRAGPSTNFPRVSTIPAGVTVTIFGCVRDLGWCDTSWRGQRGWVSARYLQYLYGGRRVLVADYGPRIGIPIVAFQFGNYWGRHYSDRPWYRDRPMWEERWARGDWNWRDGDRRRVRIVEDTADFDGDVFRRRDLSDDQVITGSTRQFPDGSPRRLKRGSSDDVPRGIRKKGSDFCPPGLAKQGRCLDY